LRPYGSSVAGAVGVLALLKAVQVRPIFIANFKQGEIQKAVPMLAAWAVRFLIRGTAGTGALETYYAEQAKEVTTGAVTTAVELWTKLQAVVPTNDRFEDAFAQATISQHYLARYFLRVLEKQNGASTVTIRSRPRVWLAPLVVRNEVLQALQAIVRKDHRVLVGDVVDPKAAILRLQTLGQLP